MRALSAASNHSLGGCRDVTSDETRQLFARCVVPNYGRFPTALVRGEGSHVWDAEGNRYLDLFCGAGCGLLGHCPPTVVEAVRDQLGRLIHAPQAWHTEPQALWAQALGERSFGGQAFFCNSGSEAVEAAIKLARLHAKRPRYKIVTFEGGFHGHTLAATAATAEPRFHEGLGPLTAGFRYAPFGDLEAAGRMIGEETAALLIEPIQGDAGVRLGPDGFLPGLRRLADEHGLLLIFDEVQTGCGRTGDWFAYQGCGVTPDVMVLSGGLCGGLAGGAMLTTAEIAQSLRPGMHGCSFGGNPIAARAGLALIETIERDNLLELRSSWARLSAAGWRPSNRSATSCAQVRVRGLMIGIELSIEGAATVKACLDRRLLVNCTAGNVIRLLPALTLTEEQAEEACDVLGEVLKKGLGTGAGGRRTGTKHVETCNVGRREKGNGQTPVRADCPRAPFPPPPQPPSRCHASRQPQTRRASPAEDYAAVYPLSPAVF